MCVADVFLICNYGILPAWALLIIVPKSVWTTRVVHSMFLPVLLAAVYLTAFVANPESLRGDFGTLDGVMRLFEESWVVLAGWVHYLVFDYFVGAWIVRDSQRKGVHGILVLPCLFFCFMAGPLGLLLYLIFRGGRQFMAKPA